MAAGLGLSCFIISNRHQTGCRSTVSFVTKNLAVLVLHWVLPSYYYRYHNSIFLT